MMKALGLKIAAVAFLACLHISMNAAVYYIATSGNDLNDGLSPATAFQTINKINSLVLEPGDQILFRRGDVFRGQLNIAQSGSADNPIEVDAYGVGNKPVISGALPLAGWTNAGENIWQVACPQGGEVVTSVYLNGTSLPLGRYPNADMGYLTIAAHTGNTSITSQQPLTTDWTGGEVVLRTMQWILDRSTITAQAGDVLTFNPTSYEPQDLWGYFIQNHIATLDEEGEWYYNSQSQTIYVYSTLGNPEDQWTEATVFAKGIFVTGSHVHIHNLQVEKTLNTGLHVQYTTDFQLHHSNIMHSGEDGMWIEGPASDVVMEHDTIHHVYNNGIVLDQVSDFIFRENNVQYIGLIPGRGKSSDGQYFALRYYGGNSNGYSLIERNVLDSLGYVGIDFRCSHITIRENVVSNYDLVKDDGGGIYTWNGGAFPEAFEDQHVVSNIVYNAIGSTAGVYNGYPGAVGIYMDDCSMNTVVRNNTVFDCSGQGLMLHGTSEISARGNTVFNCGSPSGGGQLLVNTSNCGYTNGLDVKQNIFFSKTFYQDVARLQHQTTDLSDYGALDSNYYCRPFNELATIITEFGGARIDYDLPCWQSSGYERDAHSHITPVQYNPYEVNSTSGINLFGNGNFDSTADGLYCWSPQGDCEVTWNNTNMLDGGALQLTPGSESPTYCIMGIGAVSANEDYLLTFDALGLDTCIAIGAFLRQSVDNYSNLTPVYARGISTNPVTHQILFQSPITEDDASIVFEISPATGTVWLDNIQLMTASITEANANDSILFFFNPSAVAQTYVLPTGIQYIDVYEEVYSGTVTLAPFTSIILLYIGGIPDDVKEFTDVELACIVYPNPAHTNCTIAYQLPSSAEVFAAVLDVTGREVMNYPISHQSRGEHRLQLNTQYLSPGVYILCLSANGVVTETKLVVEH